MLSSSPQPPKAVSTPKTGTMLSGQAGRFIGCCLGRPTLSGLPAARFATHSTGAARPFASIQHRVAGARYRTETGAAQKLEWPFAVLDAHTGLLAPAVIGSTTARSAQANVSNGTSFICDVTAGILSAVSACRTG